MCVRRPLPHSLYLLQVFTLGKPSSCSYVSLLPLSIVGNVGWRLHELHV